VAEVGIILRLTHTGKAGDSILLSDLGDGTDTGSYRKVGPVYVPKFQADGVTPGYVDLTYSTDVALSYRDRAIRKLIDNGYLTAEFVFGQQFIDALPSTGGGGGVTAAAGAKIQFSRGLQVPGGAGILYLSVGETVTSSAPVRMIREGNLAGVSISVNYPDSSRSYKLSIEMDAGSGFTEVESVTLPVNTTTVGDPSLTADYAAGDLLRVSLVKLSGSGDSTFTHSDALVELVDHVMANDPGALLLESTGSILTETGDTLTTEN